jgi:hypothetical protein
MHVHTPAGVLGVSLAVLFAACESGGRTQTNAFTAPSPFGGTAPFVGTSVVPTTVRFTSVPAFRCPRIAPFTSAFSLVIDRHRGPDIFLDRVAFRFVDGSGLPSPLQLTRSDLVGQFGTTLVPGGTSRTFAFRPQFGCGFISAPSTLFIELSFLDRRGVAQESFLTASLQ